MNLIGLIALYGTIAIIGSGFAILVWAMASNFPTGDDHGQYRQAGAQVHGGPGQITYTSPGRATPRFTSVQAISHALSAGAIDTAEAYSAYHALMTHHALTPLGHLGSGISNAHAMAWAQQQQIMQYQAAQQSMYVPLTAAVAGPPHPPTTLKSEGMRAGEIIAWRAWRISGDALVSVVAEGKPWSASEPMKGDPAAGYGVHAYKGPHGPLLDSYVEKGSPTPWVIGEVALWGDIIEHEEGYRAEFARVHSLVTWSEKVDPPTRQKFRDKYLTSQPQYKIDDAA